MTDLAQTLVDSFRPRSITPEISSRRQRLCDFVRRNEAHVYDVSHPRAAAVRALLGWDDETMEAFVRSPLLCHSAPHASMNSFPPMLGFPPILASAARLAEQRHGAPAVHVRTQCTHHNFSDTFSKPHAWWHVGAGGKVVRTGVFARSPIRHHPVLSKPAPRLSNEPMENIDQEAVELAELGTNYANYCIIYRMYLERQANFHMPHRVIEFPIDMLNRFTISEVGMIAWFDLIDGAGLHLRIEQDNAPMVPMSRDQADVFAHSGDPWLTRAVIAPNMVNFSQVYILGISLMLGGSRMAIYVPGMNIEIAKFIAGLDGWRCDPPAFLPFTNVPVASVLGMAEEAARCEAEHGFSTSLPLVTSAVGVDGAAKLDALLSFDYRVLYADASASSNYA